jgi:aminomethyltransferase
LQRTATVKRTPFHSFHVAAGAKIIEFAGYDMPVRYTGDVREHQLVRTAAGLFDISHMGEFFVSGPGAERYLDELVTNDVRALAVGQALYSPMCRPDGGIVDDLLIYRSADQFMVVVNAANVAKDWEWMRRTVGPDVTLADRSDQTALLAVQGPKAPEVLRGHVPDAALDLGYYRFMEGPVLGVPAILARTGYTGEDGFELYFEAPHAATVWNGLMEAGRRVGMEPVGLGARDTLRLEMGFMLYGNDIDDTTSPLEAGLGWTVKLKKPSFCGQEVLQRQKASGLARKLVGLELDGRRVARHGMALESQGRVVGQVTSGTFSPSLQRPIAMGYVETPLATMGVTLDVVVGEARLAARIVKTPFYTQGSRKTAHA